MTSGKHRASFVPRSPLPQVTISSDTSPIVPTTVRLNFQTSTESQSHWFSPSSTVHEPRTSLAGTNGRRDSVVWHPAAFGPKHGSRGFGSNRIPAGSELHNVGNSDPPSLRRGFDSAPRNRNEWTSVVSRWRSRSKRPRFNPVGWTRAPLFVLEIDFPPWARTNVCGGRGEMHGEILAANPSDYGSVNPTNGFLHRSEGNCTYRWISDFSLFFRFSIVASCSLETN